MEQSLKISGEIIKIRIDDFIKRCEKAGVTDEQWFIDWEIAVSELATKDHNKL